MAYNINKLNDKFAVLSGQKKAGGEKKGPGYPQWKPALDENGKARTYNVRFLPYQDQNEQPFQEVNFYDCKAMSPFRLVAPAQFGLEDPIAEFVAELRRDRNNKGAWAVIKQLLPKPRYFAPVLIREEAEKGVQVWELSPTVCKEIYAFLVSEDYRDEDVMSVDVGHDFQVTVSPSGKEFAAPNGKKYPVNDIKPMIRAKASKLAKTPEETQRLVGSVPDLQGIFTKMAKPADELDKLLQGFLAIDAQNTPSKDTGSNHTSVADSASDDVALKSIEDQFEGI